MCFFYKSVHDTGMGKGGEKKTHFNSCQKVKVEADKTEGREGVLRVG